MGGLARRPQITALAMALAAGAFFLFLVSGADALFTKTVSVGGNWFITDSLNAPTGVTATGGGSSIVLNWTATLDTYASGHRVLRGTASGGPYSQIAEVTPRTTTTYTDTPSYGTYYYVVRAFHQNWESANSSEVSATRGIGFDAPSSANTGTGTATTLTFSHTVSGSNRLLVVGVSIRKGATQATVSSVTYAGTSLTQIRGNAGTDARAEIWRLVAPPTGANDVVVTLSAAARFVVGAASFTGVNQTTPTGSSAFGTTGSTGYTYVNVTSVSEGDVVIDTIAHGTLSTTSPLPTVWAGQAQRWCDRTTSATAADNTPGCGSTEPGPAGGGSVAMSWTIGSGLNSIAVAVALKPAP